MITRVASQQSGSNDYAPAGLSIRQDITNAGAAHASVVVTPKNGVNFLTRSQLDGATTTTLGPSVASPVWLRIVKSGQSVAGFQSDNGYSWQLVGKTQLAYDQPFYIGFVGASLVDPTLRTYTFTNSVFMRDVPQRSADMVLWLRADDGVTVNGSAVTSWLDQSNLVYSAEQPNSTNQPAIATNAINGLPAIDFAGTSKWLKLPAGYADFDKGLSLFVVCKPPASGSSDARLVDFGNGTSSNNIQLFQPSPTQYTYRVYSGGNGKTLGMGFFSGPRLVQVVQLGKSASMTIDPSITGTNDDMHAIPNITRQGAFLGKANGSSNYFQGQICEVLLLKRACTAEEAKSIQSYFYYKYNLGNAPAVVPPSITATTGDTPPAVFTPATGCYANPVTVSMSADPLSEIRYTTDGTNPGPGTGTIYTAPFAVSTTSTVKAVAVEGSNASSITSNTVQIDANSSNVSRIGLNLWLKADLGVDVSGSNITKWADVSGNGLHAAQSSSSNRPTLVASDSELNNKPTVNFNNSSSQWLQLPEDFSSFPFGASMFLVAKPTSTQSSPRFFDFSNGSGSDVIRLFVKNSSELNYRIDTGSQTNIDSPLTLNQYQLVEIVQSGNSVTIYKDGVQGAQSTSFNAISSVPRSGNFLGKAFGSGNYFSGRIAEVWIYNRPVSADDRAGIEAYVYGKYAIGTQPTLSSPVISPPPSVICDSSAPIDIQAGNGAAIHFETATGANIPPDPTASSPVYSGTFNIEQTTTIKAIAIKNGYVDSPISMSTVTIDPDSCGVENNNLKVWLRSDNLIKQTGSSNVETWTDLSGNGNHCTQSNSSLRPTSTAGANNLPTVNFSGSSQWMQFPQGFANFTQGMTLFVVGKVNAGSSNGRWLEFANGASNNNIQFGQNGQNDYRLSVYSGSTPTHVTAASAIDAGNYHVFEAIHNGANAASLFKDGSQDATSGSMGSIADVTRTGNFLGKAFGSSGYLAGQISEVLVYDKILSGSELKTVEKYLIARYATLAVTPPVITPGAGAWPANYPITLTAGDPGAIMYYSTDGSAPSIQYNPNTPITLSSSATIKAKAVLDTRESAVSEAHIQIDNNTRNLTRDGMIVWLKADMKPDLSGSIATWGDVSGGKNDAAQAAGSSRPTFTSNAVNSLPAISFSGSNQWMQFASTPITDFTNGMSIFLVTKPTAVASSNPRFFDFGNGATSSNIMFTQLTSPNTSTQFSVYQSGSGSSVTAANSVATNQFQLLEAHHTGREAGSILTNGVQKNIGLLKNPPGGARTGNYLGRAFSGAPYFQGQMAELIVYNRKLQPDEARNVQAYLVGRYGLASTEFIRPTISPAAGVYTGLPLNAVTNPPEVTVSMSSYPSATIHYTTDGTTPTTGSSTYSAPFAINKSTTVKAIAKLGSATSPVTTRFLNISPSADVVPRTGLTAWYKTDSGVIGDGAEVSQWTDLSGTGEELDASQSDANKQPQYKTDYDFPRITTDATPRFMKVAPGFSDMAGGLTFFAVTRPNSTTGGDTWIFTASNGSSSDSIEVKDDQGGQRARLRILKGGSSNSIVTSGGTLPANKFQILECLQEGALNTGRIFIDGVQRASGALNSTNDITRLLNSIGSNPDGNAEFYSGDYTEIILYNRPLSDSERLRVRNYLATKYQTALIHTVDAPVVQPAGATLSAPAQVTITAPTGAIVYFTQDGTNPTTNSQQYRKPINVHYTQTIKAMAVKNGITSSIASQTYTLDSTLWPAPSSDSTPLNIQLQLPTTAIP